MFSIYNIIYASRNILGNVKIFRSNIKEFSFIYTTKCCIAISLIHFFFFFTEVLGETLHMIAFREYIRGSSVYFPQNYCRVSQLFNSSSDYPGVNLLLSWGWDLSNPVYAKIVRVLVLARAADQYYNDTPIVHLFYKAEYYAHPSSLLCIFTVYTLPSLYYSAARIRPPFPPFASISPSQHLSNTPIFPVLLSRLSYIAETRPRW